MQVWSTIKTISANRNKGFTLVEIMVVIIVLGLLAVLGTVSVLNLVEKSKMRVFEEEAMTLINAARAKSAETIVPDEGLCYSIEDLASYVEKDLVGYSGSVYVSGDNNYRIWLSKNPYIINSGTPENINAIKLASFVPASEFCPTSYLTITINANQGIYSGNIPNVVHEGQQITLVSPTKVGYLFTGWTVTGEGSSVNGNILTVGSENVVLSANWTVNSYTLTVNANGGIWSGTTPQTISYGGTATVTAPTKTGYTFTNWTVTGSGSSINGTTFTMGTENTTITANWQINTRELTVNANGGTWSGTTPQSVIPGNSVTINNPIKAGYTFVNWTIVGGGSSINGTTFTMGTENTTITANWVVEYTLYSYTGSYQTYTVPVTGYYNIELWGARGNTFKGIVNGGFGSYTSGNIYLTAGLNLYFYVGSSSSAFNGGSVGGNLNATEIGGGATDVRLVSGAWNDATGLKSRIMVAASGGGTGEAGGAGGIGGGLIGANGTVAYSGTGATQIAGGAGYSNGALSGTAGGFGYGGNGGIESCCGYGGGGGAGYYGGGGGAGVAGTDGAGAGGSSFISGYAGSNAITSSSSLTPTNNTIHYSNNYFVNGNMLTGVNNENGRAKITYISETAPARINTSLNNVRYIKDCINGNDLPGIGDEWVELQAIKDGINVAKGKAVTGTTVQHDSNPYTRITDGDITSENYAAPNPYGLQCITVDLAQTYNLDEIAVWHYWADSRAYNNNVTSVSSNNSNWTTVISTFTPETSQGKRVSAYSFNYDFNYTGKVQSFTAPKTGNYQLEVWGAQGGGYSGFGGYSKGVVSLNQNSVLYIGVGSTTFSSSGGYNGGGSITGNVYGGGGATHIATVSGLLNSLSSNQGAILIVAGGGGGVGNGYMGGSGGGIIGSNGSGDDYGRGGTQTGGGGITNSSCGAGYGGFGYGGSASWSSESIGAGGGGFYGGGAGGGCGNNGGGAGGSGYIANALLTSKYMYCYNCTTSSVPSTLTYSTTNALFTATSNYSKAGNGYARITYLGS